jgi:hypothetical protein
MRAFQRRIAHVGERGEIMRIRTKRGLFRACLLGMLAIGVFSSVFAPGASAARWCAVYPNYKTCTYDDINVCRFVTYFIGYCMFHDEYARPVEGAPLCVVTAYHRSCAYIDTKSCQQAAYRIGGVCVANTYQ